MKNLCDVKMGHTQFGGQTYQDILGMLSSGVITFNSLASEVGQNQWVDLITYKDFGTFLANKLMLASNGYSYDSLFNHWYVKDGERSYGPFSLIQMLEFYHQNRLHLENLIRHPSSELWTALGDTGPFEAKSLEKLLSSPDLKSIIERRKTPRIPYDNEVFISAAAELYRGVTWSLSAKGVGLVTDQSTVIGLGQKVNIIINANHEHGAVQVKGTVVNLKKEVNYERVAVEFDQENEFLNQFIDQRVPRP